MPQPTPSKFRAGVRTSKGPERISDERKAWIRLPFHEFVLYIYDGKDEDTKEELGSNVRMSLRLANTSRPLSISLSGMTVQELSLLQEFLDMAIQAAMPVSAQRDKAAEDAFQSGDDSWARHYRSPAELTVRQGAQREYLERLRVRSERVPALDSAGEVGASDIGEPGESESDLAEPVQEDRVSEDNRPTPDKSPFAPPPSWEPERLE